jgi:alpha-mannosidase
MRSPAPLLAAAAGLALALSASAARPAKYNTTPRRVEGMVNVHIVPHSHDDVGWLKTVDQYYYGANNTIQHSNVNSIISATVLALLEDPNRKFIEVEQAFFQRWWNDQTPAKQAAVQGLVASGQLEFINGGWSMHDEACPTFVDMLDNTHLGQRLIYNSFGVVPKTTWQIDPFGHSGFQGSMLSSPLSGVNGVYVARLDYQDIQQRKLTKSTEMYWAPSPSMPNQGGVLGFLPYWCVSRALPHNWRSLAAQVARARGFSRSPRTLRFLLQVLRPRGL